MIDLTLAVDRFTDYVSSFDRSQPSIELKYVHSLEVMKLMRTLAKQCNLEGDCDLAALIGLLHDYGRFMQWKIYHSFRDADTIDHADLSVKLLFEEGEIRHFIEDDTYDVIIKEAIAQHNKYAISPKTAPEALMMCQLIRDADKLDNFRVKDETLLEVILGVDADEISRQTITPVIYEQFSHHQLIKLDTRRTQLDMWLSYIAFIFDLNCPESLTYIHDHDYINRLFDKIHPVDTEVNRQYENLRRIALAYE